MRRSGVRSPAGPQNNAIDVKRRANIFCESTVGRPSRGSGNSCATAKELCVTDPPLIHQISVVTLKTGVANETMYNMKKQNLLAALLVSNLLVPMLASAITTTDSCPNLYRTLARGSRGNDVISLQKFLIAQESLGNDLATGFFGPMTEAAVQKWQAQNSIVSYGNAVSTGYGVIGPKTRAAIATRCGTKPSVALPGAASISFNYPSGDETFRIGDSMTIRWNAQGIPQNATMYLMASNGIVIKGQLNPNLGSYTWKIPEPEKMLCSGFSDGLSFCSTESFNRPLAIKAVVYTPSDACLGFCQGPRPTTVASAETRGFRIVVPGNDPAVTSCPTDSAPICGYDGSGNSPKTYPNSCYFSSAKAVKLYDGACDYAKNPSIFISRLSVRGYTESQIPGYELMRLVGGSQAAFIGDTLNVYLESNLNTGVVSTISASIKADDDSTEYGITSFQPNTPSIQIKIPSNVPVSASYRISITQKDKNGIVISRSGSGPFLIVSGD